MTLRRPRREPLREAQAMQRAAARTGFDWNKTSDLWDKLAEEIGELRADAHDRRRAQEELGDLLFMAVNLARHLKLDAPRALAAANRKFARRFAHIMRHAAALPPLGDPRRLDAMEALWQDAKRIEKLPRKPRR